MSLSNYRDIKTEVRRRIQSREWAPGSVIPSETELAAEFDCARATINRALRELAEAGLLDRRRKAGTRVSLNPVRRATLDIPLTRLEVEGSGAIYRHQLLEHQRRPAPEHIAARMALAPEQIALYLRTLHLADGRPFMHESRWINPAAAQGIDDADFATTSANEWLVQNVPISGGDIAFSAEGANPLEAGALNVPEGTALFIVDRLTEVNGTTVTLVRLAYAPGFRMQTRI